MFEATFIPLLFLIGIWLLVRRRSLTFRAVCTGLGVLVGWPVGFCYFVSTIGWTFVFDRHSPGWAVGLIPLTFGWFVTIVVWLIGLLVALASSRHSPAQP